MDEEEDDDSLAEIPPLPRRNNVEDENTDEDGISLTDASESTHDGPPVKVNGIGSIEHS